jgi:hypothetical protein
MSSRTHWIAASLMGLCAACASVRAGPSYERFESAVTPGPEAYPDVSGVILLDRGTVLFTADPVRRVPIARLRRYYRLKVLRPSGKDLGRIDLPYDHGSAIMDLRAHAIRPDGDVTELAEDAVLDKAIEGGQRVKAFTLGELEPGTIVEVVYDVYFGDLRFIPPWLFRGSLPTVLSEYAVIVPAAVQLDFRFLDGGRPTDRPPERFEVDEGTRLFWRAIDQPALFKEPSMPAPELIAPQVHVVFGSADVAGTRTAGFRTWDEVKEWLDKERAPGWTILEEPMIAEARRIAGQGTLDEQALRILTVVARDLAWEPGPRVPLWRARTPAASTVLREKRGNASSRGLLLVALLRAAGIPCFPAFAAYRDQGFLFPDLPNLRNVDGIVAVLPRGNSAIVLDPSQLTTAADVPPPRLQGTRLIVLKDDGVELFEVPPSTASSSKTTLRFELKADKDGKISGSLEARLTGAEAGILRAALLPAEPERYAEITAGFIASRGAVLGLESATVGDLEALDKPLSVRGSIPATAVLEAPSADMVSLPVDRLIKTDVSELREIRRWPFVVPAARTVEITAVVGLPEDHEPESLPRGFSDVTGAAKAELNVRTEKGPRLVIKETNQLSTIEVRADDFGPFFKHEQALSRAEGSRITIKRPAPKTLHY